MESIAFNRIVLGEDANSDISEPARAAMIVEALLHREAEAFLQRSGLTIGKIEQFKKMVFMSHKTKDKAAEREARYISSRHNVAVYMAEWDKKIQGNPNSIVLPAYIMQVINASRGFLVHVIDEIRESMWIGYEVGGAHAFNKPQAKIMFNVNVNYLPPLPAVVRALDSLNHRFQLDSWINAL